MQTCLTLAVTEFSDTAVLLTVFGVLLAACVLMGRVLERTSIPVVLVFLVLGMLAGSEGIGGIAFDDYKFAFRVGTMALILILFDGGLNTSYRAIREGIKPALLLATFGVMITAAITAGAARLFGLSWAESLLLGAVVSSTDAAVVFSLLRGSGIRLKRRIGTTLELESGLNDPMAVILTVGVTEALLGTHPFGWDLLYLVPMQLVVGVLVGVAAGFIGRFVLRSVRISTGGLFPVLTLGICFLSYGAATLLFGSGFLAVYAAAVVLGNGIVPYRSGLRRIHDAIAWLSQITMFLMLGLLVFPSALLPVAGIGLGVAFVLTCIARPLSVVACLAPFRFPWREQLYVGWVGLRGAVPIILAMFPVLSGVQGAETVFNIVFFVVVVNAFVPGMTVGGLTRRMKLTVPDTPTPAAALEVASTRVLDGDILSYYVDRSLAVCDVPISKISFPEGSSAILVVRGNELIAARGQTVLKEGDHIYIFAKTSDRPFIELLFGRSQNETA